VPGLGDPEPSALALTPQQIAVLESLAARGFQPAAFPLYSNAVGVRKGNCAVLLQPAQGGGLNLFAEPSYLVDGNLSVRVLRDGRSWFQWKAKQIEATPEREAELARFREEVADLLVRFT